MTFAARAPWRCLRGLILVAIVVAAASGSAAQVLSLYFREVAREGRIYLFNSSAQYKKFLDNGEMGKSPVVLDGYGPAQETVIAENDTAVDLYNLKHDREPVDRDVSDPIPAPVSPASLKVADGELKVGLLLQSWYVADTSPLNKDTTSFYGNTTGANTFRLRRAEIKLSGKITSAWGFEVMLDPAKAVNTAPGGDGKILQDLAVTFLGLKGHELSLGQKKIALTEEGLRSSSELDFSERAQVTRTFSDRRETGLFYKGELGPRVAAFVSVTNGTSSNAIDDSNDTVFVAARIDVKPLRGLMLGSSGGRSGGEGPAHLGRSRYGVHLKYDGPDSLPIAARSEYLRATDGVAGARDLVRAGFYASVLYTLEKRYQFGIRYDEIDRNTDVQGDKVKTLTVGIHHLIKSRNINLKADYFRIKEEGRKIGGDPASTYSQFVLAVQAAF